MKLQIASAMRSVKAYGYIANIYPHAGVSMRALFGDLCSTSTFRHDQEMHETHPGPCEDETQHSCNEFNKYCSRTSSEDEDYQNDISDNDGKKLTQGQRPTLAAGSTAIDTVLSKDTHNDDCREQGTSIEVDTTSNLFKARSSPSHSGLAQSLRSSSESEANGLRRKAKLEDGDGSSRKRARLQGEHTRIMPHFSSDEIEMPEPEDGSQPVTADVPGVSYYDTYDGVHRCVACGWEVWRPEGVCAGCGAGESAYYEVTSSSDEEGSSEDREPRPKSRHYNRYPRIYLSSDVVEDGGATDVKAEERINATGYYLDGASAYDSTSSSAENDYEMNSFIDDSPVDTGIDEHTDASASDDVDYKAHYEELASAYHNLEQEHEDLVDDHEAFRRDVLGSDYNGSEDPDEPNFDVVNIDVQDPPVSKVVLSHIQGDSQSSTISTSRLRTRVEAFLAAPEGWHNISLMSTGDNHTEESQEL
jgi:hypothetical protein